MFQPPSVLVSEQLNPIPIIIPGFNLPAARNLKLITLRLVAQAIKLGLPHSARLSLIDSHYCFSPL